MSNPNSPEPGDPWEKKVELEAGQLSGVIFQNFKHCITECTKLCPDQLNPKNRIEVFNSCAMALIGGTVNTLATYGNHTEDFEAIVIDEVKERFKFIREHQAELQNDRLAEIAKNRKKGTLIDVNGSN